MRNVSQNSLIEAMEASVFFKVVHSVSDIDNHQTEDTMLNILFQHQSNTDTW
jgi:hypothetical protein